MIDRGSWREHFRVLSSAEKPEAAGSVLMVRAGNAVDPDIFVRGSQAALAHFLARGLTIYLLDVDVRRDYPKYYKDGLPPRNLAQIFKDALLHVPNLVRVQIYAHARYDINFTDPGAELSCKPISEREPEPYNAHRLYIGDLKIGNPGVPTGLVDAFTCLTHGRARWPQLMADTLGWPVRTVAPGYSIYVPRGSRYPKSQMPSTRILSLFRYDRTGWALWLPHWGSYLPALEPSDDEFADVEQMLARGRWRRHLAMMLEPFRDWRKRLQHRALRED